MTCCPGGASTGTKVGVAATAGRGASPAWARGRRTPAPWSLQTVRTAARRGCLPAVLPTEPGEQPRHFPAEAAKNCAGREPETEVGWAGPAFRSDGSLHLPEPRSALQLQALRRAFGSQPAPGTWGCGKGLGRWREVGGCYWLRDTGRTQGGGARGW